MATIYVAGAEIPAPDHIAIEIYIQARAVADSGKITTMSIDLPSGGGAAFVVGHRIPIAITTDGPIDAATFTARGVDAATIPDR